MNAKIVMFVMLTLLLVSGVLATNVALNDDATLTTNKILTKNMALSTKVSSAGGGMGVASSSGGVGGGGAMGVVEVSEISIGEISAEEISVVLKEVEVGEISKLKRIGLVSTWRGHGWIENGEEGHLITGLWAVQKFATVSSATESVEVSSTTTESIEANAVSRTLGRLHISGEGMYKLVRYKDETSENSVNFYVIPLKKEVTVDNAKSYAVGKLSLNKENSYKGLTTWEGSLVFDSGDLSGEWDVEFGTIIKKIKPVQLKKIRHMMGKTQTVKIRMNEAVSIEPTEISETGEAYSDEIAEEAKVVKAKERVHIKPLEIKRRKVLYIFPIGEKFLEVEITKNGETYTKKINANKAIQIEDYTISVGDLENEEDIELNVE